MSKTKQFNIMFSPATREKLEQLATDANLNAASIVRQLIDHRHDHVCMGSPTCASGQRCFCPQMHPPPTPPKPVV